MSSGLGWPGGGFPVACNNGLGGEAAVWIGVEDLTVDWRIDGPSRFGRNHAEAVASVKKVDRLCCWWEPCGGSPPPSAKLIDCAAGGNRAEALHLRQQS